MKNQFHWNGETPSIPTDAIQKLTERFSRIEKQREELFMKYCVYRYLPYWVFEAVTTNPPLAATWIEKQGFHKRIYPDGKIEFAQTQPDGSIKVLETLPEP